jgi:hypothetical protein
MSKIPHPSQKNQTNTAIFERRESNVRSYARAMPRKFIKAQGAWMHDSNDGHYLDFFNMIMPATVGDQWFIGIPEIGALLFFLGLFIFVVFTTLTKAPLVAKGNPYIEESKHFHY